jgi:hypothetical protein
MVNKDDVIVVLEKNNIPITRENYLNLIYFGDVPDDINEMELPKEIRKSTR